MSDESISQFYLADKYELISTIHVLQMGINHLEIERLKRDLHDKPYQETILLMQRRARKHIARLEKRVSELVEYENIEDPRTPQPGQQQ